MNVPRLDEALSIDRLSRVATAAAMVRSSLSSTLSAEVQEIATMLIDEVIRSCAVCSVAEAAVASVGGGLACEVERAAAASGMSVGDYARSRVGRFARNGREAEMRAVASAMAASEVPVLAGLERILRLDLARA